ncbi:MAG: molybdopterin-dependent oxidoreductase, partial [Paracoccaceae bacterium]
MTSSERDLLTATHWGTYRVDVENGRVTNLRRFEHDPDPSPIGPGIVDVLDGPTRITAPMVRKSWLEGGPGTAGDKRGSDAFVEVSWAEANRLVAAELTRVRSTHGNRAIYAGSYGWASAGRFHHAQSQLKRFLNCIGGYTGS